MTYLPKGLPEPVTESDRLDLPYWEGTRRGVLRVQRCGACQTWQWGPEWLCHQCRSWDMRWTDVEAKGSIWTWTRCWHPVHPALKGHGPYIAVLVTLPHVGNVRMLGNLLGHGPYIAVLVALPHVGNVRMLGNLLGDPDQDVRIGAPVEAVFEPHDDAAVPYTLVQWKVA